MSFEAQGERLGEKAFDLGQRIKAMLTPLEDVCRYREQRSHDAATFDVTPRNKASMAFKIAIAPGGINIETPAFTVHELPLAEAGIAEAFVAALLMGRVRRVIRLNGAGKQLTAKTYLFDAAGLPLYKARSQSGLFSGLSRAARRERQIFAPYRS
jgi:hypothetical protein